MHGLIFFYLQKFLAAVTPGPSMTATLRSTASGGTTASGTPRYLPSAVYPDAEAVAILESISQSTGEPLPGVIERFGRFLAPHLIRIAGPTIEPAWGVLDLIEHTEAIIHTWVRAANPGATPPVLETVRPDPDELHLVYTSSRRLCRLARGLIRGMAEHYGESLTLEEPSCMHRGDPFCSFVLRRGHCETHADGATQSETILLAPGSDPLLSASDPIIRFDDGNPQPTSIGGHRVNCLLGRGGMGLVWLAHDDRLDRDVAVKVMLREKARDPVARERFLRESRAAAAVEHPNVVAIHQIGEDDGLPFIVMQYLDGPTLAEHCRGDKRIPLAEVLRIGYEIASGLDAAHRKGLIHRDMKSDNVILVGPQRRVTIIDFGLARDTAAEAAGITLDGAIIGTPGYMAPERVAAGTVDERADIFGLGVILYELLAGRLPYQGESAVAMLANIASGQPFPLSQAAPALPAELSDLVMRLIAHKPADRPQTAAAVAAALADLSRHHAG
ncbi:MAG: hypothetical protein DWH79_01260 [Planctomycetota bacterium]|nr:MAG: hypothetical protein DWH79_01260 [Planctomycetota bacterium]